MQGPGHIIILNGAPRSGKSSIAREIQRNFDGVWVNIGVDSQIASLPYRYRPGIGLRPGGGLPEVEALVPALYAALYKSIGAHSRLGLNVVTDVGHHGARPCPPSMLTQCAARLRGLPVLFVGVRCPVEVIMARRSQDNSGRYVSAAPGDPVPEPVLLWEDEVHRHGGYDLEIDTSVLTPAACASVIQQWRRSGASAFERLAGPHP